ncbi:Growth arrest-specific protein 7 [Bagarius yarrelli]|uniref:Growth arrest-specific protein 7 n=1 Tax=Bagarius yarrelli TaxID=175774 RepID=A0A556TIN6_BAGYA|nr:Growth arrest-specific protein 7 [Bagarius yarrelli]
MSGSLCRSLYAFSGEQHERGLRFESGELIRITRALPGGWWEGEKDGITGWFPSSYVQVVEKSASMSILPGEEPCEIPLPKDWKCYMSPQGRKYYVNTLSNETTWERPSSVPGTPKTLLRHKNSLPTVNGFHGSSGLLHHTEPHTPKQKANTDQQSPVSTSPRKTEHKASVTQINCVTFPLPLHITEQQLLKPNDWSYCDYFWADKKDPQGNASITGFEVLLQKQLKGKQMQKEMADFMRERIKIEEEYAKNLLKLSQNPLAAQEEGTLGEAWAQLKKSLADEAEVHLKFSSKLQSEVEKPLLTYRDNFKKDMKKFDHQIADLRKQLASRYAAVEKARKALAERQKDLEVKTQQLEIKLNTKIEEDIKKARRKSTQADQQQEVTHCMRKKSPTTLPSQVSTLRFTVKRAREGNNADSYELERLEVERIEIIRKHLGQYTTLRHETDMFNQSTMEPVDKLLQIVDPSKDREIWVKEHKTGEVRPVDMVL